MKLILETPKAATDPRYREDVGAAIAACSRPDEIDIHAAMLRAIIRLPTCEEAKFYADGKAIAIMKRQALDAPGAGERFRGIPIERVE